MRMTVADVHKVLGSVHKMNMGGNRVVLDGARSYMENKYNGKKTKIYYEDGQYMLYLWVPAGRATTQVDKGVVHENRFAILATEEVPAASASRSGFPRPGSK
jgi:hypothetical protein